MHNFEVEIKKVSYQRNGVGGIGFFTVEFGMKDDYGKRRPMIATVDVSEPMATRVIALDNIHEAWRGDRIFTEIMRTIGASEKDIEIRLCDLAFPEQAHR